MIKKTIVRAVEKNSIGEEIGIEERDEIISINGRQIKDIFDYRYYTADEYLEIEIKKADGTTWIAEIEKEEYEDLGITFTSPLIDEEKSCHNRCIFCFIEQLPPNMRDTLYFKDDDLRLSFLQGNYVTLTNMKDSELDRMIFYHLSPVNISVHATDTVVRKKMLGNKQAGRILQQIERLCQGGITVNFQVVLCKGVNDGKILDKTINDLKEFIPQAKSLSVVPAGLTKYRENLFSLKPFDNNEKLHIIDTIEKYQKEFKKQYGVSFVYAADEFYAGVKALPPVAAYEDFPQIENGVGMVALFKQEFQNAVKKVSRNKPKHIARGTEISVASGMLMGRYYLPSMVEEIYKNFHVKINIYPVKNHFFGETITVSGLLTGSDLINQLKGKPLGDALLIPESALKFESELFLDNVTVTEVAQQLNAKIRITKNSGEDFLKQCIST